MAAGRFYIEGVALADGAELALPDELARQARDVLRLGAGERITLLDGAGGAAEATLLEVGRKRVTARLGPRVAVEGTEPAVRITLCQGMLKAAKFEWVVQKGTELGVAAFVPLITERAVAASEATGEAKRARWRRILAEAMEQCGGTRLPELAPPQTLAQALATLPPGARALLPWEEERGPGLRSALTRREAPTPSEVWLFIGPEGGFARDEVALARAHGALPVTLGPRILRAETAALVAVALTLDALGALRRSD